jgi:hypothetical protein
MQIKHVIAIIGLAAFGALLINMMLCMYYIPLGAGWIPGVDSPNYEMAGKTFSWLQYTIPAGVIGLFLSFFLTLPTGEEQLASFRKRV